MLKTKQMAHLSIMSNEGVREMGLIPYIGPRNPFANNTNLSSFFVTSLVSETNDVSKAMYKTSKGDIINFYTLIPIYEEDRELAYSQGFWELLGKFREAKYFGVLDLNRENYGN